jgi:hypothetical protein
MKNKRLDNPGSGLVEDFLGNIYQRSIRNISNP